MPRFVVPREDGWFDQGKDATLIASEYEEAQARGEGDAYVERKKEGLVNYLRRQILLREIYIIDLKVGAAVKALEPGLSQVAQADSAAADAARNSTIDYVVNKELGSLNCRSPSEYFIRREGNRLIATDTGACAAEIIYRR